jgi:hypothetical protein
MEVVKKYLQNFHFFSQLQLMANMYREIINGLKVD